VPVSDPALDVMAHHQRRSRIKYRAKIGEPVAAGELPEPYEHDRAGRQTRLGVAI
jgi:hypothetical protein